MAAALKFIDREGLDALSMRRLGTELGIEAMSLYHHVPSKDTLLDGVGERLWADIPKPSGDSHWSAQLRNFARSLRGLFHTHPHAALLLYRRNLLSRSALAVTHVYLGVLRGAGFDDGLAAEILRAVMSYSLGYGLAELTCLGVPGIQERRRARSQRERLACLAQALPLDTPPDLAETAVAVLADCDPDACFESGLNFMLQGVRRPRHGGRRTPLGGIAK
ncbi:MAG: TetR/AcrR family transcriptional regulator [bacterium]